MQVISLADPLYQSDIKLLIGGTPQNVHTYIDDEHGVGAVAYNKENGTSDGWDDPTDGMQFHVNQGHEAFYIWIERPELDLLHHEMYHLTHDVLSVRGIEYSDGCEDAFAYLNTHLFMDAYNKLFVHKKQNRKAS